MSREEAIKVIKENIDVYEECIGTKTGLMMPIEKPDIEAFYMAIEALQQEQCGDCINREEVIKQIFYSADNSCDVVLSTELMDRIKRLPFVSPMPKMGKWERMSDLSEDVDDRYKCSKCGNIVHSSNRMNLYTFNRWCGRCGSNNDVAKMQGVEE